MKTNTVVQVRSVGAWTREVAVKMKRVIQEICLRELTGFADNLNMKPLCFTG